MHTTLANILTFNKRGFGYFFCVFFLTIIPTLKPHATERNLSVQPNVFVQEFQFTGNTIFTDDALSVIAAPYSNRDLATEQLLELKNKITEHYINHGYLNSGAVLPDQEIQNGVIVYAIKEGTLQDIRLLEQGQFTTHYLLSRINRGVADPLNIFDLQETLKLLERDANVQTIQATLEPGVNPGTGILLVSVEDTKHFHKAFSINNYNPPSVGSYTAETHLEAHNLSGWGEEIGATVGWQFGDDVRFQSDENLVYDVYFSIPITRWDTRLSATYNKSFSTVVSEDLSGLDIQNESEILSLGVRHPVFRNLSQEFGLGLRFNHKKAETKVLGNIFLIAPSTLSSISFSQDWVYRTPTDVIALYSSLDLGVNWFIPDGEEPFNTEGEETIDFVTWLFQAQYLRRLDKWDSQILVKASVRLADKSVPATEKFEFGGHATVRGYRENTVTLDEVFLFSADYQVPIYQLKLPYLSNGIDDGQLHLSIFYDYAEGMNKNDSSSIERLYSTGLGLDWQINNSSYAKVVWGIPLTEIDYDGDSDLQDAGIHFELTLGF